jgi:hypothetical protein
LAARGAVGRIRRQVDAVPSAAGAEDPRIQEALGIVGGARPRARAIDTVLSHWAYIPAASTVLVVDADVELNAGVSTANADPSTSVQDAILSLVASLS